MDYSLRNTQTHTVKGSGLSTEHAAIAVIVTALAGLILIRRGFRGVSVGGVSVGIR